MRFAPVLLAIALAAPVAGQARKPALRPAPSPVLQRDTALHMGKLGNGLRYYIRQNSYPKQRLELRLVVRAGSIQEDQDQRGLAHFVEHMAFNGTTHFEKNDLVKYLQSIGVRFGADLNANTGFDETTYILPVPSDKPELVERAFDILQDWAAGVKFDSTEVVNERGVVLGEWRDGLGAGSRVRDKLFPVLFQGSRYALRLPIGDTAIIGHAVPAPIRRFYRDWYRPDLMAVIAVGDYPVDKIEALIKEHFAPLKGPAAPRPRVDAPVPAIPGVRVSIVTDPELTTEDIWLQIRRDRRDFVTEADFRHDIVQRIFAIIAGERLQQLSRDPAAPFAFAGIGPANHIQNIETTQVSVTPKSGHGLEAFEAVLKELRRFEQHGVLDAELERVKASIVSNAEQYAKEEEHHNSATFVSGFTQYFLHGSVPQTGEQELALDRRLLPTITRAEVDAFIKTAARGTDRFIGVQYPANETVPSKAELLAVLARTDKVRMDPWQEVVLAGDLVPNPPTPGRIVSESTFTSLGVTQWLLSNGVRVLIKPTDFKADEVLMMATGSGGMSLLSDADAFQGLFSSMIVEQSGYGQFDTPTLERKLAGKIVSLTPVLSELDQGFRGEATPKDLPTLFQLLWLQATAPRYDTTAVAALRAQFQTILEKRDLAPNTAFSDTIVITLGHNSPRVQPMTVARLGSMSGERAFQVYKERFADYSGFTFLFVGNVTLDSLRPLVTQWLAALPASGRREAWKDVAPPLLDRALEKVVRKGKEPVSQQLVVFEGPATATGPEERMAAAAAAGILETRLLEQLREAMGATYGVSASTDVSAIPRKSYTTLISFSSTPALADSLWRAAKITIAALQKDGPTADELAKFVAQQQRSMEVEVRTNEFWRSTLEQRIAVGEPMETILAWPDRLKALTPAIVQAAARKYLDASRVARFVLLPES